MDPDPELDEFDDELLYPGWDDDEPLSEAEIEEENRRMLARHSRFRRAAEHVAEAFGAIRGVEKVALFGSVALPLVREVPRFRRFRRQGVAIWHECADVDLAVWLSDLRRLSTLRKVKARALREHPDEDGLGVADHQVDVFIMQPGTDAYVGRLCYFAKCPKGKWECLVPGCGKPPFLRRHAEFVFRPQALEADKTVVLYPK